MKYPFGCALLLSSLACICLVCGFRNVQLQQDNSKPQVRVSIPDGKNTFRWNSIVAYSIEVTDKEDGMSEYNEISANEVLLKVSFLADSLNTKKYLADIAAAPMENLAISLLMKSNCFTCHAIKNKLIGPSFEQVARKYPINSASIDALSNKVIAGTTGTWGNSAMPPHPDIQKENVKKMVRWIITNCNDKNVAYFTGLEGAFRTQEKPVKESSKGVYVLTASYTDHGLKNRQQIVQRGIQTILLHPEPIEKK